MKKDKNYRKKQ